MIFVALGVLVVLGLLLMALYDVFQTKHAVRRNFPLVGRLRYLIEKFGPELRQYIVTSNDEERPFSRDRRRWVYTSAKQENSYFGFGTDNVVSEENYLFIRQSAFPHSPTYKNPEALLPATKVLGEWRERDSAFRPNSIVNISAMSFGSLSSAAIEALNKGALQSGVLHNTGEGGISSHHLHGGELVFQLGTGYFGARAPDGSFDMDRLVETVANRPVKAIEVKISQGAKPGLGGVLPAEKVTPEIAAARGVPVGVTVASPARHSEFGSVAEMIDFVERISDATGLPVGIKSAVGDMAFWVELAELMDSSGRGPDFIAVDGGEGGTGAAPLVFSDHVSLPFYSGFAEVFRTFADRSMHQKVVWFGAGKLGFPSEALRALMLGVDVINIGREAMLAVGCIQAQKCHTGHCPTGVATHSKWLVRGLDPTDKAARVANYFISLRYELLRLAHACGTSHPALIAPEAVGIRRDPYEIADLLDVYGYDKSWGVSSDRMIELDKIIATKVTQ